jgi:ElaB/YqjD/DUF883 family membrane-anchored ribosome-binding protein
MTSDNEFAGTFSGGPTELNGGQDQAEQAARAAQEARQRAHDATSHVAAEAHSAIDQGADRAAAAAARARASADKLSGQAEAKALQISQDANQRVDQALTAAGQRLHTVAQQVRQSAPEGQAGELAGRAAEALDRGGSYLQSADANTVIADLEHLIRRYPLQSLAVGLGLGFFLGRGGK